MKKQQKRKPSTRQKKTEAALRESEERFRTLADAAFEGIAIHNNGTILDTNERLASMFGYTKAELIGMSALDLAAPESRKMVLENIIAGYEQPYEAVGLRKDGTTFIGELYGRAVPYMGQTVRVTTVRDITERKRTEKMQLAVYRISQTAHTSKSLEEWFQAIHHIIAEFMPAENFYIAQYDQQSEMLHFPYFVDQHDSPMASRKLGRGFTEYVLRTGIPLLATPEITKELERKGEVVLLGAPSVDWLGVPLKSREDRVIGVMTVQSYTERIRFGQEEKNILDFISNQVAMALERKQSEEAILASEERYRLLFERNLAGVFRSTIDGKFLDCNDSFARMLGYFREELLTESAWKLYPNNEERERFLSEIEKNKAVTNYEICLKRKDGSLLWALENASLLEGNPVIEGTIVDISDRKKAEEQISYQAYHDALTGLPNRNLFHDRLKQALTGAGRGRGGLAVLFLDLDHFKLINDSLGHSVGDWLLIEVADRIRKSLRSEDTVARIGGDEFILLLPEMSRSEDAARVAQKLLSVISTPLQHDRHDLYITTSIGISLSPGDGTDAETLIKSADNALYRAKELGRDNYQFWSPALQMRAQERLSLERGLRQAIERSEFLFFYQPQFDLNKGSISGVEALVRWQHPDKGLLLPRDFVQVAEETRLILPLGEPLLRSAFQQIKDWHQQGFSDLRLSVNLSAHQFQQPNLIHVLDRHLSETGLPPEVLVLEITETVAMQNVDYTLAILHTLKRKGIRIALDDFGVGYSSLSYLKHFPIDIIKIDPSFVKDIGKGVQEEALVRAVIHLGHSMKQMIIAEGVETEIQRTFLKYENCEEAQGNLFCPPLPPDKIASLLPIATPNRERWLYSSKRFLP